ncbi:MAG: ADP-heptose:LPS heptosyltransferase [candidate division TM6 bacterium GW2011_GWF2_28_16]|nr:MAG: ADP-heptose:LPS heptosyltransferase [candidate division TM6 bacterium GW2011_GWF2_28_16]
MIDFNISKDILEKTERILFISHFSIKDFVYAQNYFINFAKEYQNIKIDLYVDPLCARPAIFRFSDYKNHMLKDWLQEFNIFNKVYFAPTNFLKYLDLKKEIKNQNYLLIINLATKNILKFNKFAKNISKNANIINQNILQDNNYNNNILNIDIPKKWLISVKLNFLSWGINDKQRQIKKIIFINPFERNLQRLWPIERIFEFIDELRVSENFYNTVFIINVLPHNYKKYQKVLKNFAKQNTFLFVVTHNFFQLVSMVKLSDLVISVDNPVLTLAQVFNKPVINILQKSKIQEINNKNNIYLASKWQFKSDILIDNLINKVKEINY